MPKTVGRCAERTNHEGITHMTRNITDRRNRFGAGLAVLVLAAGTMVPVAHAEPEAPLGGPKVQDRDVPGARARFGEGMEQRREGPGVRPQMFMRAVQSLAGPEAPEAVRATPEQAEKARAIMGEYRAAMEKFREANATELNALREQAGEMARGRGGPDGRPNAGAPREGRGQATPEQLAARQKLRELNEKAPKFEPYQTRVWAVLSEPQQAHVREVMASAGRGRGGEGEMMRGGPEGRGEQRRQRGGESATPPPNSARGQQDQAARWERVRERIDRLPQGQRDRVLRELERSLERIESTTVPDAPPGMDGVNVPERTRKDS